MKCAVVQMCSSDQLEENLATTALLVKRAHQAGASLVVLPENFYLMGKYESQKLEHAEVFDPNPTIATPVQYFVAQLALRYNVSILAGTMPIAATALVGCTKLWARSILYGGDGHVVAFYDKRHLFDVNVPEKNELYFESNTFASGTDVVTCHLSAQAVLGFSVCYDVRFPEHYRQLADQGATLFAVPSAFTESTGKAHWHTLLRARAIENQCFVLAANQGGVHANGRCTYGHSVIYDPWGECLGELPSGDGVVCATLNFERLAHVRSHFPVLSHKRS